jgi:hypothetical protein
LSDFKKTYPHEKHSNKVLLLEAFVKDHLKQVLKTNGAQSDEEISLSIKNIQDMLQKVKSIKLHQACKKITNFNYSKLNLIYSFR